LIAEPPRIAAGPAGLVAKIARNRRRPQQNYRAPAWG
jgi:hypothetical protein